jgi:decaprenylphospho-beta-D-erythro-pentofuranosid-2-ulose 2-reductase
MTRRSGNVLVVGATSAIAAGFAREMARRGGALHLVARDSDELDRLANDISIRYKTSVTWSALDVSTETTSSASQVAFNEAIAKLGTIDGVVYATGILGDQSSAESDPAHAAAIVQTNYVSAVQFLTVAANYLEQRAAGFIVAIGSVAGDRGRPSNYVYGSSKGALALFAQGLRARMAKCGVHVMTVKPGFVDTKMTFGKKGMFLVADPDDVGRAIAKALDASKDVVYVPPFWALIMLIIRSIPEPIFKKMKL